LGPKTIEKLLELDLIKDVQDIYSIDFEKLSNEKGFGDKKIKAIVDAIEKSKKQPFSRVLISLGIPEVGKKIVDMLLKNGFDSIDKLFEIVEKKDVDSLCKIPLIAEKTSKNIISALSDPIMQKRIKDLKAFGLNMSESVDTLLIDESFKDQVWAVSGSFDNFNPRSLAVKEIEKRGGRCVSSLSSKTTHLLLGKGGGSKKAKAKELNIIIIEEEKFISMLDVKKENDIEVSYKQGELF